MWYSQMRLGLDWGQRLQKLIKKISDNSLFNLCEMNSVTTLFLWM
ncbi:unnamed protein product, partial [Acanthoscelides obtectus]